MYTRDISQIVALYRVISDGKTNIENQLFSIIGHGYYTTDEKLEILKCIFSIPSVSSKLDLKRLAYYAHNMPVQKYIHKQDINKTIDYNEIFNYNTTGNSICIKSCIFAIQQGATGWLNYGVEYIQLFIRCGAGRILDDYPEYRGCYEADDYHEIRDNILASLNHTNLLPVILKLVMDYIPYEIPDLTANDWIDVEEEVYDFGIDPDTVVFSS